MRALGEAATHLPWLSPCAASLLALARAPTAAAWLEVRSDPGAVLLILRQSTASLETAETSFYPALLRDPDILDAAVHFLSAEQTHGTGGAVSGSSALPGFVDWNQPALQPIYLASLTYAATAQRLAELTNRCDPENAWVVGLFAPLGWLAVCAINAESAGDCLADPLIGRDPAATQRRHWGLDQEAIGRRLLRLWRLPHWLSAIVGHLSLPVETAETLGANVGLFVVLQAAIELVERHGGGLHLASGPSAREALASLSLPTAQQEMLQHAVEEMSRKRRTDYAWTAPTSVPLLSDLLRMAAENRRLQETPTFDRLEQDNDHLHHALTQQCAAAAQRLQAQKLGALAEFAAGAGHEINNPLAVISGQAQYLLGYEPDPARQRSLKTIIGQTQRVHQLLNELMQFARPPRPQKQLIDLPELLREVVEAVRDLTVHRNVQLIRHDPQQPITLYADPGQLRTALACLLRNAVEAAPPEGWASIRAEVPVPDRLELIVEDNGKGPVPTQREHLFDPFYSGRLAGRGRGLGLPTAWRLAREHGGDVRFDSLAEGPTRFVLSLPLELPDPSLNPPILREPANGAYCMK